MEPYFYSKLKQTIKILTFKYFSLLNLLWLPFQLARLQGKLCHSRMIPILYASGPQSYLFGGTVLEQYIYHVNIYHVMAKASG